MITKRLRTIYALSIPVLILHGIEEYFTGFYHVDALDEWLFALLPFTTAHQAMFATFQVMFWVALLVAFVSFMSHKAQYYLIAVAGIVYVIDVHHLIKAVSIGNYYPGLITGLMLLGFAPFFWIEWWRAGRTI